jgi:hypothetical protein
MRRHASQGGYGGAHVVINARSSQQEAETVALEARNLGSRRSLFSPMSAKRAEIETLPARALSEFGRIATMRSTQNATAISVIISKISFLNSCGERVVRL